MPSCSGRRPEVVRRVQRVVKRAERVGEPRRPRPDQFARRQAAQQPTLQEVFLAGMARRAQRVAAACLGLVVQQALQGVERGMERRAGRAIDPLAIPSAVGHPVVQEPLGDSGNIRAQPPAVGQSEGVDAAVDLAAPVGQIVVLPTTIRRDQVRGAGQRGGVQAPVAQGVERPRRRGPRLSRALGGLWAVEVETAREERAAGPLAVGILQCEQLRAEPLGGDPGPSCRPHLPRQSCEVALDLPAQCRVGVEQPVQQRGIDRHDRQATRHGRPDRWQRAWFDRERGRR